MKSLKKNPTRNIVDLILDAMTTIAPAINDRAGKAQVSLVQVMLLAQLERWEANPEPSPDGDVTMTRLARWMGHSPAAATGLVDRLEKLGYAERVRGFGDRRRVLIRTTQKGREFLETIRDDAQIQVEETMIETGARGAPTTLPDLFRLFRAKPSQQAA